MSEGERSRELDDAELEQVSGGGAPGAIDVTCGEGADTSGFGLNDGHPPPEVRVDGKHVNDKAP